MGEKAKKKESPKKKAKSKKSGHSPKTNTPKSSGGGRVSRQPVLLERNDTTLPYNLIGPKVYAMEDVFAEEVRNNMGRTFEAGNTIKGKNYTYTVIGELGAQTYVVESSDSREPLIMKTEAALLPPDGPIIRRELLFLLYAKNRSHIIHRTHFMNFVDRAGAASSFAAVFMNKADFSLSEVRLKHLNGAEFSPQTAVRLCLETLQAVHDVHRNFYVHRDIQPKNFLVGGGRNGKSKIFITGFRYSYDLKLMDVKAGLRSPKELAKLPMMSSVFQSRRYHKYLDTTDPIVDVESWIFMCYSFFNSKSLPWAQVEKLSEREYLSQKEAFFSGAYDKKFEQLGLPSQLSAVRNFFIRIGPTEQIDYPAFAKILMLIAADLKVDWAAPYEWQKFLKVPKKAVTESEGLDDLPPPAYLHTTAGYDSVPADQKTPVVSADKGRAMDYDRSVEQSQSQSLDGSAPKDAAKRPLPVNTPKKVTNPARKPDVTQDEESEDVGSTTVEESTTGSQKPGKADVVVGKSKQSNSQKPGQDGKSTTKSEYLI